EHDCSKIQLELDDTPGYLMRHLPEIQTHVSRADNARPETIRYCKNHGLPRIQAAKKWPGSVEDGISHLRSYKNIVLHPRCKNTLQEMRTYNHKVDKNTEDVLPDIVDANNHIIDSIRYGLQPIISKGK